MDLCELLNSVRQMLLCSNFFYIYYKAGAHIYFIFASFKFSSFLFCGIFCFQMFQESKRLLWLVIFVKGMLHENIRTYNENKTLRECT